MPRNVWVVVQCDREPHSELTPDDIRDLKAQIRAELRDAWAPVIVLPPGCALDQMDAPGDEGEDEDADDEDDGDTQVLGLSGEDDPEDDDALPVG